ncbi:UNVERIFIED_CONTAM: DNA-directed RNA polymerases IV and V subunit [Sesamum radiatum]|uniref:DNA-directed RNA polymerases IV and V subunit n=1 Tax=Sesamum radiatum TaxID=300843 RepID=A0AAW2T2J1_SESRA
MAEKGGKGNLPATGGKSALKSPVGNGDSLAKSKKGKKVQFDSEDSFENNIPKSNGKADTTTAKELPPNSVCLMDCEAAEILQGIQDQMVILSQDPDIKLPVSFDMGLTYAKRGGNYAKPQTVKKILEYPHLLFRPLKKHGVSESEICLIANICPESVEEVFALVPALKPKMNKLRDPLRIALNELANLKEALANLKGST